MAQHPRNPSPDDMAEQVAISLHQQDHPSLLDRLPRTSPGLRTPAPHDPIPGLRVPKDKLKLASASVELTEALAVLNDRIREAEQFLRALPGAEHAQVALSHVDLPAVHVGTEAFLEARCDARENCRIVVSYYNTQGGVCISTNTLDEFPISTRIELCQSIPELIDQAVAAESVAVDDVLSAADAIERALTRYRDNAI